MNVQAVLKVSKESERFRHSLKNSATPLQFSLIHESRDEHLWSEPLGKQDINTLKNATRINLSLDTKQDIYLFSLASGGEKKKLAIPARVKFSIKADKPRSNYKGFEILYSEPGSLIWSIFQSLQVNDCLRVLWWADAGSNVFAKEANISIDCIYLEVQRGKDVLKFCLAQKTISSDCSIRTLRPQ